MTRTKLLCWTPFFLPDLGGIEMLFAKVLPILKQRNYDPIVVTSHGKKDLPDETVYYGIPVFRFHFRKTISRGSLADILKIKQKIANLKRTFMPHLTHIHISDPSAFFHLTTRSASPSPTLATFHSHFSFKNAASSSNGLLDKILNTADHVSTVSSYVLREMCKTAPEIEARSSVIYNGVDLPGVTPEPLSFDPPRILCIGRLIQEKGFDLVIQALPLLVNQFPQTRLTIVGDGPLRSELQMKAEALNLKHVVEFKGQVKPETVYALINKASVVVLPSRSVQHNPANGFLHSEGFPMVALEAAMMARPLVASMVGGLGEAVVHKQTGMLVENENVRSLANAIAYLITNQDNAVRMGRAGRARAIKNFSLEKCVDAYHALYQRLIKKI
jgi:glycosyltransferase involved in cell wall biosynthesis